MPPVLIHQTTISNTTKKKVTYQAQRNLSHMTSLHVNTWVKQVLMRHNYRLNLCLICHSILTASVNSMELHHEHFEVN